MIADRALRVVLKPIAFAAALGPAAWLVWALVTNNLSANPLSDVTNETGVWTLRFLCITLAITPLRRLTGWNPIIRFRRMAGLFAFFYGTLHLLTYVVLDRFAGLDFPDGMASWTTVRSLGASVAADVYKRPFITIGFTAFLCMLPLAITSTSGWIRRLGGKRWQRLHRLAYAAGAAGVLHYWWLVKADVRRPEIYAAIVAALLGFRAWRAWPKWRAALAANSRAITLPPPSAARPD